MVVTMSGGAETFNIVIYAMVQGTNLKLVNWLHSNYVNLTHEDLNASINKPEN
jgi:hypothetical protein